MKQEVQLLGDSSATGDCGKGQDQTTTWTESGKGKGPLVCSGAGTDEAMIAWGNKGTMISADVTNPDWTLKQLYSWWETGPTLE
jgi:hypothetical protein